MIARSLTLLSVSLALFSVAVGGCSSDDGGASPASTDGTPTVKVVAVEGDVAQADFCGLYGQIHCAANAGCCGRADRRAVSTDACLAALVCPLDAAPAGGAVVYDAKAAGDFLREAARRASFCQPPGNAPDLPFLVGTRPDGDDCSPTDGDTSAWRACAPGLTCALSSSEDGTVKGVCAAGAGGAALAADGQACGGGNECESGRCADGACAAPLAAGAACQSGEDCASGSCTDGTDEPDCASSSCACAPGGNRYCDAGSPEVPSNADWSSPDRLCVLADTAKNSGTTGDIYMGWDYKGTRLGCTITGGVATGKKACCTAGAVATSFPSSRQWLYLSTASSDGLKFDKVYVEDGTESWGSGTWDHSTSAGDCDGCSFGQNCNTCWLDTDDHEKCKAWIINMDGKTATCTSSIGFYP